MDTQIARQRRDVGIAQSVEKADSDSPEWSTAAYLGVIKYVAEHKQPFLVEDLREWCESNGHTIPPENGRAWGAVVRHAAKTGVISKSGYGLARSSNLSPKVLWAPTIS